MKRRDFLRAAALTGVVSAIKLGGADKLIAQPAKSSVSCDMVAVMNGTPDAMFQKAIAEMGGMGKFVKKGDKVVIKPNIGWDRSPQLAANTNPDLIAAIVKSCLAAGAKEVVVFDHTCDEWRACYKNSGIEDAVKNAGGKMAFAHEEKYFRKVNLPQGKRLKEALIHEAILDCDVWFNVPILKTHGGAKMTISMKNYMGIVWDRRYWHGNDLQQCIADCATYTKKPALNIVDAYRVMKSNGPKGRSENDVVMGNALFMSPDPVAVDTAAVRFFAQIEKMNIDDVSHITKAQELKVGTMDLDTLNIKRIRL